ncbi:MAG: hypothetical protein C4558_05550 [Dehalococcoidia bacterium]|nr:MAG: hypothetical protein C4558_05550 [Dehalococcoidia bacterium]
MSGKWLVLVAVAWLALVSCTDEGVSFNGDTADGDEDQTADGDAEGEEADDDGFVCGPEDYVYVDFPCEFPDGNHCSWDGVTYYETVAGYELYPDEPCIMGATCIETPVETCGPDRVCIEDEDGARCVATDGDESDGDGDEVADGDEDNAADRDEDGVDVGDEDATDGDEDNAPDGDGIDDDKTDSDTDSDTDGDADGDTDGDEDGGEWEYGEIRPGWVGAPCEDHNECATGFCLTTAVMGTLTGKEINIVNGYCSTLAPDDCRADVGGHVVSAGIFGEQYESFSICLRPCGSDADCRPEDSIFCPDPQWLVENGYFTEQEAELYFGDTSVCLPWSFLE